MSRQLGKHAQVRDQLTTANEISLRAHGSRSGSGPMRDAVEVDAVLSTIGFPLVGGPAGTMEGGRQAEIAQAILATKKCALCGGCPTFNPGKRLPQDFQRLLASIGEEHIIHAYLRPGCRTWAAGCVTA